MRDETTLGLLFEVAGWMGFIIALAGFLALVISLYTNRKKARRHQTLDS